MEKYKRPNPNCTVCNGTHINMFAKYGSRLEECSQCRNFLYPKYFIINAVQKESGEVFPVVDHDSKTQIENTHDISNIFPEAIGIKKAINKLNNEDPDLSKIKGVKDMSPDLSTKLK